MPKTTLGPKLMDLG